MLQTKKNKIYLAILIVLMILSYFVVFKKHSGTISDEEKNFAVVDTATIYKIFMADKDNNQVILKRDKGNWTVNNKFPARKGAIYLLLTTLKRQRVRFPVSEQSRSQVIAGLATKSTKVELYDKDNNLIKSFYVGGASEDYLGSYMLMEIEKGKPAKTPMVVTLPGFDGYLSVRYFLKEVEWRSRMIFNYAPSMIQSLSMNFPYKKEQSFTINTVGKDSFNIVRTINNQIAKKANMDRIKLFLSYFSNINAEAYQNNNPKKDSVLSASPFCIISVKDFLGKENKVSLYYMPLNRKSKQQYDQQGNIMPYDLDHYYASINNGKDFVIVQDYVFAKLFRLYSDFVAK